MPVFYVNEYFTRKDCFQVLANTPQEARAKVMAWYDARPGGMAEPDLCLDPDVAPEVICEETEVYVDADGYTVCDANGDEVLYD